MSALAQRIEEDLHRHAANDDCFKGRPRTRTKYVYDVYQQSLLWQNATPGLARRAFAADIDGNPDGELEIVVVARDNVYTFRPSSPPGQFMQAATYAADSRLSIVDGAVGDTDGDGDVEILLLVGERDGRGTQVIRLDGNLQSTGTLSLPWEAAAIDIEPSSAPRKNLLVSRLVGDDGHSSLAIVGAQSGGVVFESPPLIGTVQPGSVHFVTLPGETRPRISIGTSDGMYLTR